MVLFCGASVRPYFLSSVLLLLKLSSDLGISWLRPFHLQPPSIERPYPAQELSDLSEWRPYPQYEPVASHAIKGLIHQRLSVCEIGIDIHSVMISETPGESSLPDPLIMYDNEKLKQTYKVERRLQDFYQDLPSYAQEDQIYHSSPTNALMDLQYGSFLDTEAQIRS